MLTEATWPAQSATHTKDWGSWGFCPNNGPFPGVPKGTTYPKKKQTKKEKKQTKQKWKGKNENYNNMQCHAHLSYIALFED